MQSLTFDGLSILNFAGLVYLWFRQRPNTSFFRSADVAAAVTEPTIAVCTKCKSRVAKWQPTSAGGGVIGRLTYNGTFSTT